MGNGFDSSRGERIAAVFGGANCHRAHRSCTPLVHTSKRRPNQIHLPARFRFRPFELTAHQFGTLSDNAAIESATETESSAPKYGISQIHRHLVTGCKRDILPPNPHIAHEIRTRRRRILPFRRNQLTVGLRTCRASVLQLLTNQLDALFGYEPCRSPLNPDNRHKTRNALSALMIHNPDVLLQDNILVSRRAFFLRQKSAFDGDHIRLIDSPIAQSRINLIKKIADFAPIRPECVGLAIKTKMFGSNEREFPPWNHEVGHRTPIEYCVAVAASTRDRDTDRIVERNATNHEIERLRRAKHSIV